MSRRHDLFEAPRMFVQSLGTFWSRTFREQSDLLALMRGAAAGGRQASDDWRHLTEAVSRKTCPLNRREDWHRLELSSVDAVEARVDRFDSGNEFDGGGMFDSPVLSRGVRFPLPALAVAMPMICNRVAEPSATLFGGVDYYVDVADGTILFAEDPFASDSWTVVNDEDGNSTLEMWAFGLERDFRDLETHFGYVIGVEGASTESYRAALNAYYDCLVHGSGREFTDRLVAALCGVELGEGDETVEAVEVDNYGLFIATDKKVYRFAAAATPLVAVGDAVRRNQPLADVIQFFDFVKGVAPAELTSLYVPAAVLGSRYQHGLYFDNLSVASEVEVNEGGTTDFSFPIEGFPGDVDRFWSDVRDLEAARGYALSELLDDRENGNGPPTAAHLPATVNPLEFLAANVFRYHLTVAVVNTGSLGPRTFGPNAVRLVRNVFPPESALLIVWKKTTSTTRSGGWASSSTPFSGMTASAGGPTLTTTMRTKRTGSRCL